jgi:hypothetical protein
MTLEQQNVVGIAIAALGAAAVGLEREWSGHGAGNERYCSDEVRYPNVTLRDIGNG